MKVSDFLKEQAGPTTVGVKITSISNHGVCSGVLHVDCSMENSEKALQELIDPDHQRPTLVTKIHALASNPDYQGGLEFEVLKEQQPSFLEGLQLLKTATCSSS